MKTGLGVTVRCAVDAILFFVLPTIGCTLAKKAYVIDSDTYRALMLALATAGLAYIAAFALAGRYVALNLRRRFTVFAPAFLFASAYWLVLLVNRIAHGNALEMIFGLVVSGAIAWRRITSSGMG